MDSVTLEDTSLSFLFIEMNYSSKLEDEVMTSDQYRIGLAPLISLAFREE